MTFNWQDKMTFTLKDDFTFSAIKYHDVMLEQAEQNQTEMEQERFDVDFFIMTEMFQQFFGSILTIISN